MKGVELRDAVERNIGMLHTQVHRDEQLHKCYVLKLQGLYPLKPFWQKKHVVENVINEI